MNPTLFKEIYTPDYSSPDVPESVKQLKPIVFPDNDEKTAYCCVYGDDPQIGIFGCGNTPEEAMKDWDRHYQEQKQKGAIE